MEYNEIKHLIKHHTTPGVNKPVSIPGQGNVTETKFEQDLYDALVTEHDRIALFVKSKTREIERRLSMVHYPLSRIESVLLLTLLS